MKQRRFTIFRKLSIIVFTMLAILSALFISITYFATTYYYQASTQLLNKDVASHISVFTSPFTSTGIDQVKADSVFQNAMVLSPAAEVYFLDTNARVIYFHASEKDILQWQVDRPTIQKYLRYKGEKYIRGTDPRDINHDKIFSAASVKGTTGWLGYIYVVLDSKKSESIVELLRGNYVLSLAIKVVIIILLLSFVISLLYLKRVGKSFSEMIEVLVGFEKGNYNARFDLKSYDEMISVKQAFNNMGELLSQTINKLKRSEAERKNLLAAVSHDLRTPLAIARGYSETILIKHKTGSFMEDEKKQHEQLIYNKLLQLENMVTQLFELSKMDAAEFNPHFEPFVFSEIIEEAVNTQQLIASDKKIKLACEGCQSTIWINADVSLVERVIQNLTDNAIKNTSENGHVEITVTQLGGQVTFTIANDAPPLSESLLEWINSQQHISDQPPVRPQKTGLGLVIVNKILALHQSFLKAVVLDSRNVFSFSLPVYKEGV